MSRPNDSLTLANIALQAASQLAPGFTPEDLTIQCHKLDPKKFGLRGHLKHPDHHRAYVLLCGLAGMVGQGLLARDSAGRMSLTDLGMKKLVRVEIHDNEPAISGQPAPGAPTLIPGPIPPYRRHDVVTIHVRKTALPTEQAKDELEPSKDELERWNAGRPWEAAFAIMRRTNCNGREALEAFNRVVGVEKAV